MSSVPRSRVRTGFTIVEVIVAILILTVGVLGLAGAAATVTRMMARAEVQSDAAARASERFERLRSMRCPVTSGSATSAGISERWVVLGAVGNPNMRLYDVVDTVSYRTRNGMRKHGVRSVVRCLP